MWCVGMVVHVCVGMVACVGMVVCVGVVACGGCLVTSYAMQLYVPFVS